MCILNKIPGKNSSGKLNCKIVVNTILALRCNLKARWGRLMQALLIFRNIEKLFKRFIMVNFNYMTTICVFKAMHWKISIIQASQRLEPNNLYFLPHSGRASD